MKMKTRMAMLLALLMTLSLCACGGGGKESETDMNTETNTETVETETETEAPLERVDETGNGNRVMTFVMGHRSAAASVMSGHSDKLTDGFYRYPQITKNLRVADKDAPLCDENVKKALTRAEKMLSGEGRILLRKSGTEPLIRIMAESKSEESCRAAIEEVEKEARKYCV